MASENDLLSEKNIELNRLACAQRIELDKFVAYIRQDGVHVILVSEREQPFDTAFARTLALDPRSMRYIGVKSAAHFRAGFEDWAGAVYVVGEPGVHDMETAGLTFRHLGRNVYPFGNI